MQHKVVKTEVINSHLSDHSIVLSVLKSGVQKLPPRIHESRSLKNYCKQSFVDDLSSVPWNVIEATDSVDDAVSLWEHLFCSVADQHAPIKKKRLKGFSSPWVTENLISIRQDRDYFHRKARRSNGKYHWNMYRKLRNYANREEKHLKSKYFCNLIEESKSDSQKMWSTIKKVLPTNVTQQEVSSVMYNNKTYTNDKDIASVFNKHFSSIGHKLSKVFGHVKKVVLLYPCTDTRFELKPIPVDFVYDQLRGLKANKAIGLDKISARLLKDAS
jgi:hypothetical protein